MVDDKTLVERLRVHAKLDHDTEWFMDAEWFIASAVRPMVLDSARAAKTIERLTRERDEARAALATTRNDALEKAANVANECGRHNIANAIRAMKREPADD
jgi:hypothetical protein